MHLFFFFFNFNAHWSDFNIISAFYFFCHNKMSLPSSLVEGIRTAAESVRVGYSRIISLSRCISQAVQACNKIRWLAIFAFIVPNFWLIVKLVSSCMYIFTSWFCYKRVTILMQHAEYSCYYPVDNAEWVWDTSPLCFGWNQFKVCKFSIKKKLLFLVIFLLIFFTY